jgi:chemotaxis protein methyltransferase CheR
VTPLHASTFRGITALMHAAVGLSFADIKLPLVSSRLEPRIRRLGLGSFEDYLDLIAGDEDGGEFQMAVDLLTTNETYFFREPAHFDVLEREIRAKRSLAWSAWSAASSFGDEAYSIAMLLADLQGRHGLGSQWSVLGTDISDRVLRSASQAVYPLERLRGEGESEGLVQMQDHLRQRVRFGQLNLSQPIEPLGPFDAVFLRNVLIYFDAKTKREVVDRVLQALRPGGLFFIGTAEGRVACGTVLEPLAPGVFRKRVS